ncbi:hypothetical protein L615_000100001730 [Nocardioides sp. J9]|uniref:helix-turn-helix transcriptional regulator n=1 Tax=Nocardioides sp. J9 TaxID=935844 RepID=UPI0011ADABF8|nr:hypothetical protein [Nocardioides sp. J9]TWH05018.1 hypothetical protein L615_000100001730 [Nocardioides sp. J9]
MTDTYGFAPTEKMLTPTTLAEMLEISLRHLADLRREDKTFPAPVMLGKSPPRWSPATIRRWMDPAPTASCHFADDAAEDKVQPKATKKAKGAQRVHRAQDQAP